MFNSKQIQLMKKIGLKVDFLNPSDEDWVLIEEKVGNYYVRHCLDEKYEPTAEGVICESILDSLP